VCLPALQLDPFLELSAQLVNFSGLVGGIIREARKLLGIRTIFWSGSEKRSRGGITGRD
jgi:hypothetical protein